MLSLVVPPLTGVGAATFQGRKEVRRGAGASGGSEVEVTILGWDKINARKDVANPSWFKFKHSFFEDPDFYDFSRGEILSWIYLLCLASKKSAATVFVTFEHAERVGRVTKDEILGALKKLTSKQIVHANVTCTDGNVTAAGARIEEIREEKSIAHSSNSLESVFQEIYKLYPRKRGKSPGLKICRKQIKTVEDAEKLRTAVQRFSRQMGTEARKNEFVMYFDSFMRQWTDWLDLPEQTQEKPKQYSLADLQEMKL